MRSLRNVKLVDDLVCDFASQTNVRVNQHVGLTVKWLARFQKLTNFAKWIRIAQQRTVALAMHAFPDLLRRSPEADHQGMAFQLFQIITVRWQTAAGRNDRFIARTQFGHDLTFEFAEVRLAVAFENFRDGLAGVRLNHFVRVQKIKTERVSNEAAHGRFACAHEADQCEVLNFPRVAHAQVLAQSTRVDTLLFSVQALEIGEDQLGQIFAVTAFEQAENRQVQFAKRLAEPAIIFRL